MALLMVALVAGCGGEPPEAQEQAGQEVATPESSPAPFPLGVAVEFNDHAAAAMVALERGWFEEAGLDITSYESYVTGADLAAALARGDIQAAYLCLVPALSVIANSGLDVRVVAGTHKYGYALVADPNKMIGVEDLGQSEIRIGCTQPGTTADMLLNRLCKDHGMSVASLETRIKRMSPPMQVLALNAGSVDVCLVPEHWATLAESLGYTIVMPSQEIWPDLQGSVLVVKGDLIRDHPDVVRSLVQVTERASTWINQYPDEAATIIASALSATGEAVLPEQAAQTAAKLQVTPEIVARSMARLEYTASLVPDDIQAVIEYMDQLGYLKQSVDAGAVLDLGFLGQ